MLLSMTGYGQGTATDGQRTCQVEIRTLNSRGFEFNLRAPHMLRVFEQNIRKTAGDKLVRGKLEINISWQDNAAVATGIDLEKLSAYWSTLETFANDNQILPTDRLLAAILQLPDVNPGNAVSAGENEWTLCEKALEDALKEVAIFRQREGLVLKQDIESQLDSILVQLKGIVPFEEARVQRIRERIKEHAAELLHTSTLDDNRVEQEMIMYIEKLDISEEKVRLEAHCQYFRQVCLSESTETGKKLGFIAQEMGREINTIGSKANDANIQHLVVQMKDALERIKEQLNNIL